MLSTVVYCVLLQVIAADPFWITTELVRVDWREGCLDALGCSKPAFKILHVMLPLSEEVSISWPVSEHFVQSSARPFVSHWTNGTPADITMSCQVVGTDPKYGFPRVCDEAPSIHIFEERLVEASVTPEETSVFSPCVMSRLRGGIMLAGMVGGFVLAVYATLASIFTFVLVAFLRRKRRQIHVQPQDRPYATISCRSDPTRYEIPWEFTCRLPYWMPSSSKFEATTALQLEPSSSFAAPSTVIAPTLHTFRPGCSTPPTHIYQQIPDNPSIGPGHDSGLGFI